MSSVILNSKIFGKSSVFSKTKNRKTRIAENAEIENFYTPGMYINIQQKKHCVKEREREREGREEMEGNAGSRHFTSSTLSFDENLVSENHLIPNVNIDFL